MLEAKSMKGSVIERYAERVGYSESELTAFGEQGHRIRHVERLAEAAPLYSIEAQVVKARHCNSGHFEGQKIILDIDGNLITKLCPKRACVYLISQLSIPVALINERLRFHETCQVPGYRSELPRLRRSDAQGERCTKNQIIESERNFFERKEILHGTNRYHYLLQLYSGFTLCLRSLPGGHEEAPGFFLNAIQKMSHSTSSE